MDFTLSLLALIVLSPLLLLLTIVGTVCMGGNPFFTQLRPGKDEKIFKLIKFRSMNNKKDEDGNLLPDEQRLTKYGKFIRATSMDELPELINIIKGDMSIVGPRPQLVRDMVFMSEEQRRRHDVRPGLSGLAQVSGRNAIDWEGKLSIDLEYVKNISFIGDCKIIIHTIIKVLKREDISDGENATALDYGDMLLQEGGITLERYNNMQECARKIVSCYESGLDLKNG